MGQAKNRGTFEERVTQAKLAGRDIRELRARRAMARTTSRNIKALIAQFLMKSMHRL